MPFHQCCKLRANQIDDPLTLKIYEQLARFWKERLAIVNGKGSTLQRDNAGLRVAKVTLQKIRELDSRDLVPPDFQICKSLASL